MLDDAWLEIRNSLIELWSLHSEAIVALAMVAAVGYLVYRWQSAKP
jgi:hypothetical protein